MSEISDNICYGSRLEESAEHAFYYRERIHPLWDNVGKVTAHISPKILNLNKVISWPQLSRLRL